MSTRFTSFIKAFAFLLVGLVCLTGAAYAAGSSASAISGSVASLANNVKSSFGALAQLITAGAYVAGFAFVLVAIFKFKQHKDNTTNITIGTPIAMLFIGAAMIFLPSIISTTGKTVFGSSGTVGGVSGISTISGL